ncbi:MAG TPA: hypothetical protein VHB50_05945, partial [Bryobacteraceae bacterium]|nr:hypothetical protein [Bryobacteraceae bacterium]
ARQIFGEFKSGNRTKEMSAQIAGVTENFNKTMDRINSGQGTVGQFVVNPQFEDSLRGVERQVTWLTTQVPKHPSKYVSIRLALF